MSTHDGRPVFPKRAIVTSGMPYGNKDLHFGHVGGVFIHADIYARFLRDRIGPEQVLFISGTDCYGSAIEISYQDLKRDGFDGTIRDYLAANHARQKETLDAYGISLDIFAASALGEAGETHRRLSEEIFRRLYDGGYLRLEEVQQFYDEESGKYLNGRQVTGRCPIAGCRSESAYADECSLGHQYSPNELIQPVSVTTGKTPSLKTVRNWYFDLERFAQALRDRQLELRSLENCRQSLVNVIEEFLKNPMIYVKNDDMEAVEELHTALPEHTLDADPHKTSAALVFTSLSDREQACRVLKEHGIRYRTGKTLVPFRLSGNVEWGIPVPEEEGINGLTFWVWPESLWAPVSFCKTILKQRGCPDGDWARWWKDPDADVYQFIGEDNIYFYAIAEMGLFMALHALDGQEGRPHLPIIVPNRHVFYGNKKASSSSANKPPRAIDLLDHYTAEQLRMHFAHMALANRSVSFTPKSVMEGQSGFDATLVEGNILTNVYNRLVRSCFYTAHKYSGGKLPACPVSGEVLDRSEALIRDYEWCMYRIELFRAIDLMDAYLRDANKNWAAETKRADAENDEGIRSQILADSFHVVRVAATLLHPFAPEGTEMVREYLGVDERLWDWAYIFEPLSAFMGDGHAFRFLEPRVDFFRKHPSQLGS